MADSDLTLIPHMGEPGVWLNRTACSEVIRKSLIDPGAQGVLKMPRRTSVCGRARMDSHAVWVSRPNSLSDSCGARAASFAS